MAREQTPDSHCAQCGRRLSKRQALVDWAPLAVKVMWDLLQSFWF
ncbi:hypothetical protein ACIP8U_45010 [Streptomyces pseudovenezuelae]